MADEKKDPEFPKPPKPPLTPPLPPALGKGVPPLPMQKLPPMQGGGVPPVKSTGPAAAGPAVPQEDLRIRDSEEKRKEMERKVLEMEKKLQEEREKVLLANLRSQEEAALSSKVEVSLKEIQEKLRRDRREQEMEEARARLEGRVKELEQKLAQERETWVHTLKGSMRQKEVQDREVETHFTARIQELERRWLEEKAQWQKAFLSKEEEIRTLKVTLEKMKGLESDILRLNMEKQNWEKDVSGLRSRLEETQKGKSELEAQVRGAQEKEKEFFELKSQLALLKSREERLMVDLERAQHDLATVGQRLEQEKEEELKTLRSQLEEALEAKEKQVAQLAQEKIRAVSELIKQRSTLTRLQAINVALERDRNQARAERAKIQQSTQGQTQEVQKLKEDLAQIHDRHLQELRDQQVSIRRELEASFRAELERQVYSERERAKKEKHGELMNFEKELRARLEKEWEQKTSLQSSAVGELQQARGMAERSLAESEQKLSELQSKLSEAQQRVSKEESSRQALIQQNSQMDQALKNKANELIQQEANFNQKLNLLKQDTDARIKALQGQVESEKKKGADLLKQVQIKGEVEKKYKTVYPLAFLGVLGLGILGVIGWWWYQDLQ
ncbi:MAG: hypothetical protein HY400_02545, partial [Elusimicrobia bacterium]|nr:hypothetical protein [Elusimicrobiota bacterium]